MEQYATKSPSTSDVLHFAGHSQLSAEEIAKAVARHKREHPDKGRSNLSVKPQSASPCRPKR